MTIRPRLRLPLIAVPAIIGGAYLVRSLLIRRGDFQIDRSDALVLAIVVSATLVVAWARHTERTSGGEADAATPPDGGTPED